MEIFDLLRRPTVSEWEEQCVDEDRGHGRSSVDRSGPPPRQCSGNGHGGTGRAEINAPQARSVARRFGAAVA